MDVLTKSQRHKNMSHIRATDTKPEQLLRKSLWQRGIRYRKNCKKIYGTPDIAITRYRIAIFVDGDFWHAKGHQDNPGVQISTNKEFWQKKLSRNVERDKEVNDILTEQGWLVLRFWESDIRKNMDIVIAEIMTYILPPSKNISM